MVILNIEDDGKVLHFQNQQRGVFKQGGMEDSMNTQRSMILSVAVWTVLTSFAIPTVAQTAVAQTHAQALADTQEKLKQASADLDKVKQKHPDPSALIKAENSMQEARKKLIDLEAAEAAEPAYSDTKLPPTLRIICVQVVDSEVLRGFETTSDKGDTHVDTQKPSDASRGEQAMPTDCAPQKAARTLVGTGDVIVSITAASFENLMKYQLSSGYRASLFVNGVDLKNDALLVGIERSERQVHLHYNVKPGLNSRTLWESLYRSGKAAEQHDLHAALGWNTSPASTTGVGYIHQQNYVAVTDPWSFFWARVLIVVLVVLGALLAFEGDAFRDAKTPIWYREALALRSKLRAETSPKGKQALLMSIDQAYDSSLDAKYLEKADEALTNPLDSPDQQAINMMKVGLALRQKHWEPPKATYSLGRLQLGMWFLFAVSAGLFLWVVYGKLPDIENSLLAILGFSVGVTGMSAAIDQSIPNRRFKPSVGWLTDITTDFDERQQVHRYQAVIVNLMLLFIGIAHVMQHLSYPIFEPTWLAFLGISGVALAAGKQVSETKPADAKTK